MPFTMSQASLPVFEVCLNALSAVLDKAAAHATAKKIDPSVMLGWRLVPDMFALTRQVQVACDQAKNGGARLASAEPPKFEDNETSIDQLKERIAKTVAYVKTLDTKAIERERTARKIKASSILQQFEAEMGIARPAAISESTGGAPSVGARTGEKQGS